MQKLTSRKHVTGTYILHFKNDVTEAYFWVSRHGNMWIWSLLGTSPNDLFWTKGQAMQALENWIFNPENHENYLLTVSVEIFKTLLEKNLVNKF